MFEILLKIILPNPVYRCILSPNSLAVVLRSLLDYKQKGLGEEKGIITLVMAACSFDDIFCISAFGVCLTIIFSEGNIFQLYYFWMQTTFNLQVVGRDMPCKDPLK